VPVVRARVRDACDSHGSGRHGAADAEALACECLDTAEAVLSDGRSFVTGEHLSEEDAAIFAQLELVLRVGMQGPAKEHILKRCPGITRYCERIRSVLYPELKSLIEPETAADASRTSVPVARSEDAQLTQPLANGEGEGEGGGGVANRGQGRGGTEGSTTTTGMANGWVVWAPDLSEVSARDALPMLQRYKALEKQVLGEHSTAGRWAPAR